MCGLQRLQCKENLQFSVTNQSGNRFCHSTFRLNFMQDSEFCRLYLNVHSGPFSSVQTSTLHNSGIGLSKSKTQLVLLGVSFYLK
jgi:hypothetical protein